MDPKDFYRKCLDQATAIVKQIQPDQLANETPDDEWTVRDLVNHMMNEVAWVPDMVAGRTIAEVGGAYDGELYEGDVVNAHVNLKAAWDEYADKAERAATDCNPEETAHVSYGNIPVADYLMQTGGDILVHAWDLAKAIGVPITFDPEVARIMWVGVKDVDLTASGLFKAPLSFDEHDTDQDKIIAHFGRDKNWTPSS